MAPSQSAKWNFLDGRTRLTAPGHYFGRFASGDGELGISAKQRNVAAFVFGSGVQKTQSPAADWRRAHFSNVTITKYRKVDQRVKRRDEDKKRA
jgi:hypothetical protein